MPNPVLAWPVGQAVNCPVVELPNGLEIGCMP